MTLLAAHRPPLINAANVVPVADRRGPVARGSSTVLMCPPSQAALPSRRRDLHSWGPRAVRFDRERAAVQWATLRETIESLGITVELLDADGSLPAQTACGDAALISGSDALVARFAAASRDGEDSRAAQTLSARGLRIESPPADVVFEAGQVVLSDLVLYGGWFARRELLGLRWAARQLAVRLVPLRLEADGLDRLDLMFRPLRSEIALLVPEAVNNANFTLLRDQFSLLLPVPADEALRGACGCLIFDDAIIIPTGCPATAALLDSAGFRVLTADVSEFRNIGCTLSSLALSV